MPKFLDICELFCRLPDKNAEWLWTIVHNDTVETIEHLIFREPLLRYYRLEDDVTIECDSSQNWFRDRVTSKWSTSCIFVKILNQNRAKIRLNRKKMSTYCIFI